MHLGGVNSKGLFGRKGSFTIITRPNLLISLSDVKGGKRSIVTKLRFNALFPHKRFGFLRGEKRGKLVAPA